MLSAASRGRDAVQNAIAGIGGIREQIQDTAKRIKRLCHSDSAIELVPYEQVYGQSFEDMRRRVPSIEKIRQLIGWQPTRNLDQIIESMTLLKV